MPSACLWVLTTVLTAGPPAARAAGDFLAPPTAGIRPVEPRCEYETNPLGIDALRPRLSWQLEAGEADRGQRQTAYEILAAPSLAELTAGRGLLWDSGRVASSRQLGVVYAGQPLRSGERIFWTVRAWDRDGRASSYSPAAWFEMGLLSRREWGARWIMSSQPDPRTDAEWFQDRPAPVFRKEFTVGSGMARARLYITGLGYYEARVNGRRMGNHVLDPGWTDYRKRILYSTYDAGPVLVPGRNCLEVTLGNGWYNPLPLRMWDHLNLRDYLPVGRPRLLARLEIEYARGRKQAVVSDESWKVGPGPVLRNSVYLGETLDNRVTPGAPATAESDWQSAVPAPEPGEVLQAQSAPPIRATALLTPVKETEQGPNLRMYDFGRNLAGRVLLRATGPEGMRVRLRYGELLHADGTLNPMTSVCGQINHSRVNARLGGPETAEQSDTFVLRGAEKDGASAFEDFRPEFTFHGFRYVELTWRGRYPLKRAPQFRLWAERLNSDVESTGTFECSNRMLNQVQEMVRSTELSNLFSVQSDCPHREKLGYGGDLVATSEMAILNFDMERFYAKTVRDFGDAARPDGGLTETAPYVGIADAGLGGGSGPVDWGTAHPLLLWQLYQYYGDRRLLAEQYGAARRWVAFLQAHAPEQVLDSGIGDHETLAPKDTAVSGTFFYWLNVALLRRMAHVLDRPQDEAEYARLASSIAATFRQRFLDRATGKYGNGTQASQSFGLMLATGPNADSDTALGALHVLVDDVVAHDRHLTTGIFGTRFMLRALSDGGRADLAYRVVDQRSFPGWGFMLEHGATTLWEHWAGSDDTYSNNHPMFGSVSEWFYRSLAGIAPEPDAEGFDRFVIRPRVVPGLDWVRGRYRSVRGTVISEWKREGTALSLTVEVPVNTTATVWVPAARALDVTEGGRPTAEARGVRFLRSDGTAAVYRLGSGRYRLAVHPSRGPNVAHAIDRVEPPGPTGRREDAKNAKRQPD